MIRRVGPRKSWVGGKSLPLEAYLRRSRCRTAWVLMVAVVSIGIFLDRRGWLLYPAHDVVQYEGRWFNVAEVLEDKTLVLEARDRSRVLVHARLRGLELLSSQQGQGRSSRQISKGAANRPVGAWEGRTVCLRLDPLNLHDSEGHLLAYLELDDGTVLNEQLVACGLARADRKERHSLLRHYLLLEEQARHDGVGIWAE